MLSTKLAITCEMVASTVGLHCKKHNSRMSKSSSAGKRNNGDGTIANERARGRWETVVLAMVVAQRED